MVFSVSWTIIIRKQKRHFIEFSEPMLRSPRNAYADYTGRISIMNGLYQRSWTYHFPHGNVSQFDVIVSGFSIRTPTRMAQTNCMQKYSICSPLAESFVNIEHVASPHLRANNCLMKRY